MNMMAETVVISWLQRIAEALEAISKSADEISDSLSKMADEGVHVEIDGAVDIITVISA